MKDNGSIFNWTRVKNVEIITNISMNELHNVGQRIRTSFLLFFL